MLLNIFAGSELVTLKSIIIAMKMMVMHSAIQVTHMKSLWVKTMTQMNQGITLKEGLSLELEK